jgi:hypothetical protein
MGYIKFVCLTKLWQYHLQILDWTTLDKHSSFFGVFVKDEGKKV